VHLVSLHEHTPPRIDLLVDVVLTGQTSLQLPLSEEANGRLLYFRALKVGSMMRPIGPE